MKSNFFVLFISIFGIVFADAPDCSTEPVTPVRQNTTYLSLGFGPIFLVPVLGINQRIQSGHHGADFSFQFSTIIEGSYLKTNLLYHYYFKPNLRSQSYLGVGMGPGCLFTDNKTYYTLSPGLVFGKQYQNETSNSRFIQAQLSIPTFYLKQSKSFKHIKMFEYPLLVLTYGLGF